MPHPKTRTKHKTLTIKKNKQKKLHLLFIKLNLKVSALQENETPERRYTNGQLTHRKMLNDISHQREIVQIWTWRIFWAFVSFLN